MASDVKHSVRSAGQSCHDALDKLVDMSTSLATTWPEEQLIRFNLWAAEAGVFETERFSLDSRVRKNHEVRMMLIQILESIAANVTLSLEEIGSLPKHVDVQMLSVEYSKDNGETCQRIGNSISRLIRLSRLIRRHHLKRTDVVADAFDPKGQDGELLVTAFSDYVEWLLDHHPHMRLQKDQLKTRIHSTMIKRWRRVSYYSTNVPRTPTPLNRRRVEVDRRLDNIAARHREALPPLQAQPSLHTEVQTSLAESRSVTTRSEPAKSIGLTLSSGFKPRDDQVSTVSASRTKSLKGTNPSEFPPSPALLPGGIEFFCPLCGSLQPATEHEDKAWRLHVSHDLSPYICLYEDCRTPDVLYRTSKEWLAHMTAHQVSNWFCGRCDEIFQTEEEYSSHLPSAHEISLTPNELSLLADLNSEPRVFNECLICGLTKDNVDDLQLHMAEHLRQLALLCLPWNLQTRAKSDDAVANSGSQGADSSKVRMDEFIEEVDLDLPLDILPFSTEASEYTAELAEIKKILGASSLQPHQRIQAWTADVDVQLYDTAEDEQQAPHYLQNKSENGEASAQMLPPARTYARTDEVKRQPIFVNRLPSGPPYLYMPLKRNGSESIRIFRLQSGKSSQPLLGEFVEVALGERPNIPYELLSHSWGDQTEQAYISIPVGTAVHSVSVSLSVYLALASIRHPDRHRDLWADALCINTHDLDERSAQVLSMPRIFKNASRVLAWLGECSEEDEKAIRNMSKPDFWSSAKFRDASSLSSLAMKPLLLRRWVVLEFCLARETILMCSDLSLPWNRFSAAVGLCNEDLLKQKLPPHPSYTDVMRLDSLMELTFERGTADQMTLSKTSLASLVTGLANFAVTDPRDTIYAFYAIARESLSPQPGDIPLPMLDYDKTALEVYTEFILWVIKSTGNLDIICRPWVPFQSDAYPSWMRTRYDDSFTTPTRYSLISEEDLGSLWNPIYAAGTWTRTENSSKILRDWMQVEGTFIGRVKWVSDRLSGVGGLSSLWEKTLDIEHDLGSECWSFFVANRSSSGAKPPETWAVIDEIPQLFASNTNFPPKFENLSTLTSVERDYLYRVEEVLSGRRIILIESDLGGDRIHAIAHRDTMPGDEVSIFQGCSVPCIVREFEQMDMSYRLVGDAYVHGYMEGIANQQWYPLYLR